MKKMLFAVPIVAVALGLSAGCATKKYVNTRTGEVNTKVETLSKSLEENQERTRTNEGRIVEVDQKAVAAGQKASAADKSAQEAQSTAKAAGLKVDAVDQASRRLVYEVALSEAQGNFTLGKSALPADAKAELDKVVGQLKANPKTYFIEIEGHTDTAGSAAYNRHLGLERAEAVKAYLYEAHQVPLHKMNVISYGETKPVAGNKTRAERAENRRVVVRILA